MNKHKIIEWLVKIKMRLNWGNEITTQITTIIKDIILLSGSGGIIMIMIERYIGKELPIFKIYLVMTLAILINKIIDYWCGYKMEKIGFKDRENTFVTQDNNSHLREMAESIKNIEKKINGHFDPKN